MVPAMCSGFFFSPTNPSDLNEVGTFVRGDERTLTMCFVLKAIEPGALMLLKKIKLFYGFEAFFVLFYCPGE